MKVTILGRKAPAFKAGDIRFFLFLPDYLKLSLSIRPIAGQAKSRASSLSSAELKRLWEEPTEASGNASAVGIHAIYGAEDVKRSDYSFPWSSLLALARWRAGNGFVGHKLVGHA